MTYPALDALRALYRPSDPRFRGDLTAAQRSVLTVLVMHAGDDGTCWPSVPTIMRASGFRRAMVLRTLAELVEAGAISREPRPPQSTLYTVHHMDRPPHGPSMEQTVTVHHMDSDSPPHGPERLNERLNEGRLVADESPGLAKQLQNEAAATAVFDYWSRRRAEVLDRSGPPMKATAKRMGRIRARLAEGYAPADLMAAVDAVLASDFHVKRGHTDVELICRDQAHVEQYLALKPARPSSNGTGATVSRHRLGVA